MTPDRWQRVKELFNAASELDAQAQARYLGEHCRADPELDQEVRSLLSAHQARDGVLDRNALDYVSVADPDVRDRWIGQRVGAYELTACLGRGGMGEVYRARRVDQQYDKEVAIKVVRGGYDTAFMLQRFSAERQILATLDHASIARLMDAGVTDQGQPYLVMELVEGEPIDQHCATRALSIRERLRLFREICAAVSYAHRHLIVHRDLKPNNILVTSQGTIKLLDFGIAKLLQGPGATDGLDTVMPLMPLTPAFASPEQLQGAPITTASDVYSLGVVLFHLLTGRSPYRKPITSAQDALREVCDAEPLRPSLARQLSADGLAERLIARDLDDIVLMALRKEPDRRYGSVEQLSEDVGRYLAGLPVLAHRGRIGYRAGKFARRHKVQIGASLLAVIGLVSGVVIAMHQAHLAEQQRVRAERDFARTRALANSLIFELHDSIRDLPGATAARKMLVGRALQYLDSLAQESGGELALQRELASAYQRIGDVQGNPFAANLGDSAGALHSYARALALRGAVVAAHPGSVSDAVGLAEALRSNADALSMNDQGERAAADATRAVALLEPLARAHPRDPAVLEELVADYASLAGILGGNLNSANLGNSAAALSAQQQRLAVATRLADLDTGNTHYQTLLRVAQTNLGDQLLIEGKVPEAAPYYRDALRWFAAHANEGSGRADLDRLHAEYMRLTYVQLWNRDLRGALASIRAALSLASRLSTQDPNDARAQLQLASDEANYADPLSQLGQSAEARVQAASAVARLRALCTRDPSNAEYQVTLGLAQYMAGEVARRGGDVDTALRQYRSAQASFARIHEGSATNLDARLDVVANLVKVAEMQAASADEAGARASYLEALRIASGIEQKPEPEEERYAVAAANLGIAALEFRAAARPTRGTRAQPERLAAACAWYRRGREEWASIQEPGPLSPNGFYTEGPTLLSFGAGRCE